MFLGRVWVAATVAGTCLGPENPACYARAGLPPSRLTAFFQPAAQPPASRIQSILSDPFRGSPHEEDTLFLERHESAIRQIGKEGLPFLIRALSQRDADLRLKALLCLTALGPDAAPAVNAIRPLLKSRKDRQAYWAIVCLGEVGGPSMPAVPNLLSLLKHPDGCPFWETISEAIGRIAKENNLLPDGLSDLLNHKSPGARHAVLFALGECGPLAEPLLRQAIARLADPGLLVRVHAALALGKIRRRPEFSIPALLNALQDPKPSVRCAAAAAIGKFGPEAEVAVPKLMEMLRSPISLVRADAAAALGKIGPKAAAALPALTIALEDRARHVREAAAKALDSIRKDTQDL